MRSVYGTLGFDTVPQSNLQIWLGPKSLDVSLRGRIWCDFSESAHLMTLLLVEFAPGCEEWPEMGAAIWLPPGTRTDEETLDEIFVRHIDELHLRSVYALFEKMAAHHPKEPHWYLPLIGVDPAYQRRGLGSALLRYALATCDRDQSLAYLEPTSPVSVPLYSATGSRLLER